MLLQGEVFQPPGLLRSRVAKTGTYTVVAADNGLIVDATSGTWSLDLTAAATLGAGFKVAVYNSGSGTITIDPAGTETIRSPSGTATTLALVQGQGVTLLCDGSNWLAVLGIGLTPAPSTALTVNDSAFTVQNSSDTTKKFQFLASGITTGITRAYTVPNADGTIPLLGLAQTWSATQTFAGIDATSIGATTRGTGLFTTLGANSTATLAAINASGNFAQTGSTTFSTGTGTVSLNGAVTCSSTLGVTGNITGAASGSGNSTALIYTNAARNAVVARYNDSNSLGGFYVAGSGEPFFGSNVNISGGNETYSRGSIAPCKFGNSGGSGSNSFSLQVAAPGTSGNTISWTDALTVSTAGVITIPLTTDGILVVNGKITAKASVPGSFADLAAVQTYLASILT